jgi:hypothetical protein
MKTNNSHVTLLALKVQAIGRLLTLKSAQEEHFEQG